MNEKIKQHLIEYCKAEGWDLPEEPQKLKAEILEILQETGKEVFREKKEKHRWWNEVFVVKWINGMLIGYMDAETTGDSTPMEIGWEFDERTICEVEVKTETKIVTTYIAKL